MDDSDWRDASISVKNVELSDRRFRVISSVDENASSEEKTEDAKSKDAAKEESQVAVPSGKTSVLSPDEEDSDDAFFAKSFALNEARESNRRADDFTSGLRSLFDSEEDDASDETDNEDETQDSSEQTLQRELEAERKESLDGVLNQNDEDFLAEAGRKYEAPQTAEGAYIQRNRLGNALDVATCEDEAENNNCHAKIRPESILEAMLFVGDRENRPLTLKTACRLMRNVSELEAIEALADLNERYYRDGSPYKIVKENDGYRMVLRSEYLELVSRFNGKTKEFKLSQTAIDVLALIAYRQPIAFEEILEVRNNAGSVLNQLVKRDLISQEKQLVDKKKVTFYKTTERFLTLFNLASLDDLPIVGDIDYR